jgi:hypothetical protein
MAKKTDEEIKAMTPDEIRKAMIQGADLDDEGNPKQKDSSLKIRIELDLEVEVHLTARVQGDVTIGLLWDFVLVMSIYWLGVNGTADGVRLGLVERVGIGGM